MKKSTKAAPAPVTSKPPKGSKIAPVKIVTPTPPPAVLEVKPSTLRLYDTAARSASVTLGKSDAKAPLSLMFQRSKKSRMVWFDVRPRECARFLAGLRALQAEGAFPLTSVATPKTLSAVVELPDPAVLGLSAWISQIAKDEAPIRIKLGKAQVKRLRAFLLQYDPAPKTLRVKKA